MEYVLSLLGLPSQNFQKADSFFLRCFYHVKDHFVPHYRNNYHPHVLSHGALALFSALLVTVKIFTIAALTFGSLEPAFSSAITPTNIIALTNASRETFGLSQLTENQQLAQAAQAKADDMLAKGYFAHTTPDGKTPWDFISAVGYSYLSAGENLAVNFSEAEDVETAWMNSPGHKANILNKNFEQIGIGISQGVYEGHNAIFVVQMFGLPVEQKISINDKPTTLAPPLTGAQGNSDNAKQPALKQPAPPLPSPTPEPALAIAQTSFMEEAGSLKLAAQISGQPVKVLAKFGQMAVMLLPQSNGTWSGEVQLTELARQNSGLVLEAQDIKGVKVTGQIATFSASTQENFNVLPQAQNPLTKVNFFGLTFDPKNFENKTYLIFIAALLSCLILSIAIKRHVQHLSLITNASFVVVLAVGLWLR